MQNEVIQGYEVKKFVVFEDRRGIALAENPNSGMSVTWQFTDSENGERDYYWGRYTEDGNKARSDYAERVADYQERHDVEKLTYKYYSTQRPVDIGTYPKGDNVPLHFFNYDKRTAVEDDRFLAWGVLEYAAPLTEKQIADYELKAAPRNPDVRARMRKQAQIVGAWEDANGEAEPIRLTRRDDGTGIYHPMAFITPEQMAKKHNYIAAQLERKPRPIAEQLAEAGKQVQRDTAPTNDKKPKTNER